MAGKPGWNRSVRTAYRCAWTRITTLYRGSFPSAPRRGNCFCGVPDQELRIHRRDKLTGRKTRRVRPSAKRISAPSVEEYSTAQSAVRAGWLSPTPNVALEREQFRSGSLPDPSWEYARLAPRFYFSFQPSSQACPLTTGPSDGAQHSHRGAIARPACRAAAVSHRGRCQPPHQGSERPGARNLSGRPGTAHPETVLACAQRTRM